LSKILGKPFEILAGIPTLLLLKALLTKLFMNKTEELKTQTLFINQKIPEGHYIKVAYSINLSKYSRF